MKKLATVVNLDPIDRARKKSPGLIGRFFMTRRFRGKKLGVTDEFGHYLFVGAQRQGKTVSFLFFMEYLRKNYQKAGKTVLLFSNMGIGAKITKFTICDVISQIEYDEDTVFIFLIDELQAWFPKDTKDPVTLKIIDKLTGQFSQLGKRQIYVLSTAQIYGRVHKNLREQCLYMVHCRRSFFNKCVNDFIPGDNVLCDDLGRWSGSPVRIFIHGLPETKFDTHMMITDE